MKQLLWCIRRELWEHRWLYRLLPLTGAIIIMVSAGVTVDRLATLGARSDSESRLLAERAISTVFDLATRMILITGTAVALMYCAESLHGERRDRAILFWKTWPVSDRTAVVSKVMVAMVIVPSITLALLFAAQLSAQLMLRRSGLALHAPMASAGAAVLEVIAATLWIAPMYAWFMLVSAWARRSVVLLAILPGALAMGLGIMVENSDLGHAFFYRGVGRHWPMPVGLDAALRGPLVNRPAPELLRAPALWGGVVVAVLLLWCVIALRRRMTILT